jgi:hypothetical protein
MMTMNLDALSGCIIRKALNASRVRMSYHNKHVDGSGNFGFVVVFEKGGVKDIGCGMTAPNESWYNLHGQYNSQKQVYGLSFSPYSTAGARLPDDWTRTQVFDYCARFIAQHEGTNEPEKVMFT